MARDKRGQRVVGAILGLARELGMEVVAEGIEMREELRWLLERGCTFGQGYLLGRPQPIETAMAMLNRTFEI